MTSTADTGAALQRICDALQLAVSAAQLALLAKYLAALQQWNATYNLTSVRDRQAMLTQHLADCLAVVPSIQQRLASLEGRRVLDVGSGGGLPGAVLAVMLPTLDVTCVDAVGKKMAFVRHVAGTLGLLNLHARHVRVDMLSAQPFHLITSRAFASLPDFVALTHKHLAQNGVWAAMKGRVPVDEIAGLPASVEMFHVEQLFVPDLAAERCLVWMRQRNNVGPATAVRSTDSRSADSDLERRGPQPSTS